MRTKQNKHTALKAVLICLSVLFTGAVCASAAVYAEIKSYDRIQINNEKREEAYINSDENARQYPLSASFYSARLSKDQQVLILGEKNGWIKIMFSDNGKLKTGFIKKDRVHGIQDEQIAAQSIELDKSRVTAKAGESIEIQARILPLNSTDTAQWSSSDESVAKVQDGKITVLKSGKASVTVKAGECSRSIEITAIENDPALVFDQPSYTLNINETLDLNGKLKTDFSKIEWQTSNSDIVCVDGGIVKAKSAGAAVITAKASGARANCRIYILNTNKNASKPLNLRNAYGNIYNYHPSVFYFEKGWNGYKYWCAYTPYSNSEDYWENPHIEVSNDLKNWSTPKGFSNPLEPVPENHLPYKVYNSDTELVYNTNTKQLECWWRFFDKPNNRTVLRRKTTKDGVQWSKTEDMLTGEMGKCDFLSPALLYENGVYRMWSIDQNAGYSLDYRESKDGKNWKTVRSIKINYKDKKLRNWHIDLIHTAKGYEALISAFNPKSKEKYRHMDLYYVFSADNISYTTAEKIFSHSESGKAFDNMGLYRSSLLYANGKYYMFYSALNKDIGPAGIGLVSGKDIYTMS